MELTTDPIVVGSGLDAWSGLERVRSKLSNDFNETHDVCVELSKLFRWNPKLFMDSPADYLNGVPVGKFGVHMESGHIPSSIVSNIPITRNLGCILLVEHRVKDWLIRKTWREFPPIGSLYQYELLRPYGPE